MADKPKVFAVQAKLERVVRYDAETMHAFLVLEEDGWIKGINALEGKLVRVKVDRNERASPQLILTEVIEEDSDMNEFKVGDVVILKSGGSPMTVTSITPDIVRCTFFELREGTLPALQTYGFQAACLMLVRRDVEENGQKEQ